MGADHAPPVLTSWRASDGYILHGRVWPATGAAREAFVYLHGIQSHGGWFERSAALLAESGAAVVLPDRRGSGRNGGPRGDAASIERLLADLDEIVSAVRARFGVARVALVAVSWGGRLAVEWALRRREWVSRMLLIAPGVFPAVDVGLATRARIAAALLAGGRRLFEIPLSDAALFTDNPARQAFIRGDADKLTHATARFLYASSRLEGRVRRLGRGALPAPAALVLASDDRIIRNEPTRAWFERVSGSRGRAARAGGSDNFCVLRGAHTLEFGTDAGAFFATIALWRDGKALPSKH